METCTREKLPTNQKEWESFREEMSLIRYRAICEVDERFNEMYEYFEEKKENLKKKDAKFVEEQCKFDKIKVKFHKEKIEFNNIRYDFFKSSFLKAELMFKESKAKYDKERDEFEEYIIGIEKTYDINLRCSINDVNHDVIMIAATKGLTKENSQFDGEKFNEYISKIGKASRKIRGEEIALNKIKNDFEYISECISDELKSDSF